MGIILTIRRRITLRRARDGDKIQALNVLLCEELGQEKLRLVNIQLTIGGLRGGRALRQFGHYHHDKSCSVLLTQTRHSANQLRNSTHKRIGLG